MSKSDSNKNLKKEVKSANKNQKKNILGQNIQVAGNNPYLLELNKNGDII